MATMGIAAYGYALDIKFENNLIYGFTMYKPSRLHSLHQMPNKS
jgi:hypothetical protein